MFPKVDKPFASQLSPLLAGRATRPPHSQANLRRQTGGGKAHSHLSHKWGEDLGSSTLLLCLKAANDQYK